MYNPFQMQQAEEDEKTETEDEEWGGNVLDAMANQLGMRKELEKDIRDPCQKREFAQRPANFSHADQDGNPVMMTKRKATRDFNASSRDTNYRENVRLLVGGGSKKGFCAVPKCDHPELELLHKCSACTQFIHVLCSTWRTIWQEKMIALTALVIATQVSWFNLYCILY
jgi:hypothetical protein